MNNSAEYFDSNDIKHACDIHVDAGTLNIYLKDEAEKLIVWHLKSLLCTYSGGILTAKLSGNVQERVECRGELAAKIYNTWSRPEDTSVHRSQKRRRNRTIAVLCLIFLSFALLLYAWVIPWAAEKAVSLIPAEVEMELGQGLAGRLAEPVVGTTRSDSLMQEFVNRLDLDSDYPIKVRIIESEEINAFALPGGNIFVYSGILCKMKSHSELVALLGHEISHVQHRHSLKSICRSAASGLFIAALFGDASGISAGLLNQADEFRQLQYSRELETEADLEGLAFMRRNGVDQNGMLNLLNLLKNEGAKTPRLMKYLSSHPETEERIEAVNEVRLASEKAEESHELESIFEELVSAL